MSDGVDYGRAIYLLLIILPITAWIYYEYRHRLGTALRNLLLWVLLISSASLLYVYRGELVFISHKVLSTTTSDEVNGSNLIRIEKSLDGRYYVDVLINSVSVRMAVDARAAVSSLTRRSAEAIGLDTAALPSDITIQTSGGIRQAGLTHVQTITVGALEITNPDILVFAERPGDTNNMGQDILKFFSFVSNDEDRLILQYR